MSAAYSQGFYEEIAAGSADSAALVVPHIIDIVRPASVVDVGCGTGTWAAEFLRRGVPDILGIDGPWVDQGQLKISAAAFLAQELERPLAVPRQFDLAISVEVAEHLTAGRAASFVDDLTRLAPVVLFSAAVPQQGGTNHLNEQWASYWSQLFAARGFDTVDCLRARFWNDRRIPAWYRQNMLLYVRNDRSAEFARLAGPGPLDIVHPHLLLRRSEMYLQLANRPSLGFLLRSLPGALARSLRSRLTGYRPARFPIEDLLPKV